MKDYFKLLFYGTLLIFTAFLITFVVSCHDSQIETPQPVAEVKLKKISYSAIDFQTFQYNTAGKITKYTTQWQFVQNDPTQIKKLDYDFQYDASGKLVQINTTGGGFVKYYYKDNVLEKTEEIDEKGRVQIRRTYTFINKQLTEEFWETNLALGDKVEIKVAFQYDNNGNLVKEISSIPDSVTHVFVPYNTVEYSGFDTQYKADDILMRYPYLPEVTLQKNNPATKVFKSSTGSVIFTENYTYQYDEKDKPVKKVREITYPGTPSAQLVSTFEY